MFTVALCLATIPLAVEISLETVKLQGRWRMVEGINYGQEVTDIKNHELIITATHFRFTQKGENRSAAAYRLRFGNPKSLDLVRSEGGQKGVLNKGIYKLEKDRLTLCIGLRERPQYFRPVGPHLFGVYERLK